jgi:hypothetical protein
MCSFLTLPLYLQHSCPGIILVQVFLNPENIPMFMHFCVVPLPLYSDSLEDVKTILLIHVVSQQDTNTI